jgi:hypothetical protein
MEKIMFTKYILLHTQILLVLGCRILTLLGMSKYVLLFRWSISKLLQHLPWICSGEVLFSK